MILEIDESLNAIKRINKPESAIKHLKSNCDALVKSINDTKKVMEDIEV